MKFHIVLLVLLSSCRLTQLHLHDDIKVQNLCIYLFFFSSFNALEFLWQTNSIVVDFGSCDMVLSFLKSSFSTGIYGSFHSFLAY